MLVVGPGRIRIRVPGRIGLFLALGDVAVRLARLAHPVGEDGSEERPHKRDAGACAADTRLEHGPEERVWYRKSNVGIGEAEEGHQSENADDADAAKKRDVLGSRPAAFMVLDGRGLGTLTTIRRQKHRRA